MTKDKIFKIKEHIEIHARREPWALRITEILWEAVKELEQYEKMKCCENCKHHCFWGDELKCRTLSYDEELECMKTKSHWELNEK